MDLKERLAGKLNLVGGRLCLDFVNTVGGRRSLPKQKSASGYEIRADKFADYIDLLSWSLHVGLLPEEDAQKLMREARRRESEAASVLERAVSLREAIYRICTGVINGEEKHASDFNILNRELSIAHGRVKLAANEEGKIGWKWTDTKNDLDKMLWMIADSAAEMLTDGDTTRLRQCGGEECGWLFEDTSRNRSRQWCVMQDCGNVAKVRRFRQRIQEGKSN